MKRRILSLVLVLSLLIGTAVRPQRADAVVATTAAVAASAAAILTACGVSYWAASQTDAVNYIAGKIDDYLASIDEPEITYEEWLEIGSPSQLFEVVSSGVMRFTSGVANKLLDFCRWLQNDEGIESDGDPVVDAQSLQVTAYTYSSGATVRGSISAFIRGDIITIYMDDFLCARENNVNINMLMPDSIVDGDTVTFTSIYNDVQSGGLLKWFLLTSQYSDDFTFNGANFYPNVGSSVDTTVRNGWRYLTLSLYTSGEYHTGTIQAKITADAPITSNVIITPSDFVNVPADIASASTFDVSPSVALSEGDSVDDAAQSILDGITSEDGLSSAVEETQETTWGWLYTLLVNIANAISDGISDIKSAIQGLADSIYSRFTTVLQDIKTGISTIVNSITSAVSQLLSAIQALPTTIYSQFTQVLQDIKTGIQGIALDIYTDVINALTYVFVPSQAFIDTYVASLYATFDNHFSILSYPFSILGEFITRASGIGSPEPMFTWGNIYEPFSGKLLIAAGSYNLNSMLSNQTFAQVYSIYMIVVKGLISFAFLKFLYSWFCDVFKMREDDFSSPFDVEEEDDGADFDGYDGYYTS